MHFIYSSFHNKLKTTYLKGKVNRRVDFLLSVLFHIEEDNFFNYRKKCQLPLTNSKDGIRHERAMAIPAEGVQVLTLYTSYIQIQHAKRGVAVLIKAPLKLLRQLLAS